MDLIGSISSHHVARICNHQLISNQTCKHIRSMISSKTSFRRSTPMKSMHWSNGQVTTQLLNLKIIILISLNLTLAKFCMVLIPNLTLKSFISIRARSIRLMVKGSILSYIWSMSQSMRLRIISQRQ